MAKKNKKICTTCKHHVSVHNYDPRDEGRAGPKKCTVPACTCTEYTVKSAQA